MKNLILILIGAPGAGKGTQAKKIAEFNNYILISTGDILRDNVEKNTKIGIEAKSYMDKGVLVPTELVVDMIRSEIKKSEKGRNFLFDGFPRDLDQNGLLEKMLLEFNMNVDKVIYINVDDNIIYDRITNRRICPKCKRVYHIKYNPPKEDNLCDDCKVELIIRNDDKADVIKKRLDVYHNQTEPLINYYNNLKKLVTVNGEKSTEDVYKEIISYL
ncbi:MAG: adenylate kinase [bacterium]